MPTSNVLNRMFSYHGSQSFFYVTCTNELYCCGYNKYGQLGLGHTSEYIIKPTLNKYFKNNSNRYIEFTDIYITGLFKLKFLKITNLNNNRKQLDITIYDVFLCVDSKNET